MEVLGVCLIWGTEPGWKGSGAHLGLVQRLRLILALLCDQLILGPHRIDDAVQVQEAVIVHRQDNIGVADVGLHLGQLLQRDLKSVILCYLILGHSNLPLIVVCQLEKRNNTHLQQKLS